MEIAAFSWIECSMTRLKPISDHPQSLCVIGTFGIYLQWYQCWGVSPTRNQTHLRPSACQFLMSHWDDLHWLGPIPPFPPTAMCREGIQQWEGTAPRLPPPIYYLLGLPPFSSGSGVIGRGWGVSPWTPSLAIFNCIQVALPLYCITPTPTPTPSAIIPHINLWNFS